VSSAWRALRVAKRCSGPPSQTSTALPSPPLSRSRWPSPFQSLLRVGTNPFGRTVSKSNATEKLLRTHGCSSKPVSPTLRCSVASTWIERWTNRRARSSSPSGRKARSRSGRPSPSRSSSSSTSTPPLRSKTWSGAARSQRPSRLRCSRVRVVARSRPPLAWATSRSARPSPSQSRTSTRTPPELRTWSSSSSRRSGSLRSGSARKRPSSRCRNTRSSCRPAVTTSARPSPSTSATSRRGTSKNSSSSFSPISGPGRGGRK
jgi:hypothetical protein